VTSRRVLCEPKKPLARRDRKEERRNNLDPLSKHLPLGVEPITHLRPGKLEVLHVLLPDFLDAFGVGPKVNHKVVVTEVEEGGFRGLLLLAQFAFF